MTQVYPTPDWTAYGPRPRPLGFGGYNGIPWGPGLDIQVMPGYQGFDETPAVVTNDQQRTLQDGTWSAPPFMGSRTVTASFVVLGSSEADVQNKLATLEAAWDQDGVYRDLWAFNGTRRLVAQVRNRAFVQWLGGRNQKAAQIQMQWYARDPYWYGQQVQSAIAVATSSGGLTFPLVFPLQFGTVSAGGGVLENPGRPTPVQVHIPGPCSNPFIGSDTLGIGLSFNIQLTTGQWLDIDSDARTVLLNGTASRNNLVVGQSQFFGLIHGENIIRFRSSSGRSSESAIVTWSPRWR